MDTSTQERRKSARAPWTLRAADGGDLASVRALLALARLPWDGLIDQFGDAYVVAESGAEVVGVAGVERHGNVGLLRSVAVAPEWRLTGVGADLVRNRIAYAAAGGLESVYLLTTDAARYFSRHGFSTIERHQVPEEIRSTCEYRDVCPDSARVMRRDVRAASAGDTGAAIREVVREHYGRAAREAALPGASSACCGGGCGAGSSPVTTNLYDAAETHDLPDGAVRASLGCGNPTLLAELREGETVLDLGSGGGIDVLLSARRVGPRGFAYGLDMTDDMLDLARRNQREAGVANVEFLRGEIESVPLPDARVDVIISNCVINLSADKRRVLTEAFRVLKPGGRLAVSDIVVRREMPDAIRQSAELWAGCVAGALEEWTYRDLLRDAGFADIEVVPTRVYTGDDAREIAAGAGVSAEDLAAVDGAFMSAFVRARKPVAQEEQT